MKPPGCADRFSTLADAASALWVGGMLPACHAQRKLVIIAFCKLDETPAVCFCALAAAAADLHRIRNYW